MALILLGVEQGDEVIASTFTFSATINPILYLGAIPILVDSEPKTWNMSPELLQKAIEDRMKLGKKPKAIIPVHLYGMPAEMDKIAGIAEKYGIPIIEDAAEALGSKYRNRPAGSLGTFGILSFNGNKIITTSGGGALMSDKKELIQKARFLATQARDKARHYQHSQVGYNYRMSNIVAGIGRGQMEVLDQRVEQKRNNYSAYKTALKDIQGISFLEEPDQEYFSNRWLTTILIDQENTVSSMAEVYAALQSDNIDCRPLWKPMHLQPVFSKYPAYTNGISEGLFQQGLCLPSGSGMSDDERGRVLHVIQASLKQ